MREQILKAKAAFREIFFDNESNARVEDRLVLNLTYHPLLRDFQKVLNDAQILLTPKEEHTTVLGEKPPMIGWRKACTIKDYLVTAKITNRDTEESKSARCNSKRCQVCQYIKETCEFEDAQWNKYDFRKGVINCNTDFTVYKFHRSSCYKQYVGSNKNDFRYRFNNYTFRKVSKPGKPPKVNQELFHLHFKLLEQNVTDDWRVNLINRADNRKEVRRRESFWQ